MTSPLRLLRLFRHRVFTEIVSGICEVPSSMSGLKKFSPAGVKGWNSLFVWKPSHGISPHYFRYTLRLWKEFRPPEDGQKKAASVGGMIFPSFS
jgi:hypothetical protein